MSTAGAPETLGRAEFPLWGGLAVAAVTEQAGLPAALAQVKRIVAAFDLSCSNFRDDSELARLNQSPREDVVVSQLLFDTVREALRAASLTGGAVDPTVGQVLVAHRINPPLSDQPLRIEPVPGYRVVKMDEAARSIRLPAGVQLDLGATAKARAADLAAEAACAAAGCGVLVSLCGDIAVAGTGPEGGWGIRVTDDHRRADTPGQMVAIEAGGLATSSVTVRRSGTGPDSVSHLIDPASGRSVGGPWRTVSVTAASCLEANIASTAAIVLGDGAIDWLEAHRLPARLVSHDGAISRVAGWPPEGDEL